MSDPLGNSPKEEAWPPAPTLPPPEPARPPSFVTLHPVLYCVLLCALAGTLSAGVQYLLQWSAHASHIVSQWHRVYSSGFAGFVGTLGGQLYIQHTTRREERQRELKNASLKAKALTAQDAVEQNARE